MRFLDLTLPSPQENLALDEALLLEAEQGDVGEVLRCWESPSPFVVTGIGARVEQEVYLETCQSRNIPVLRRCSGGGTVVQGRGCLNYALVLQIPEYGPLTSIRGTNRWIMERHALMLSALAGRAITTQGHTDLAVDGIKVSGNAQRRLRHHLLFHGTFLLNADLTLINQLLPVPELQPEYRRNRSHGEFLANLELPSDQVREALRQEWGVLEMKSTMPMGRLNLLVAERYARSEWNLRR